MEGKQSYWFDFLILSGLASTGVGLFLLYGIGVTALTIGVILMAFGILGHRKK